MHVTEFSIEVQQQHSSSKDASFTDKRTYGDLLVYITETTYNCSTHEYLVVCHVHDDDFIVINLDICNSKQLMDINSHTEE